MPYRNIVFTKLKCELATDERFTDKLDDTGKLIYFCLLLMAGVKRNKIPDDEKWLKRVLNLQVSEQKIRENLQKIFKTFPKLISKNGFLKFKNYSKLHNPLGKSQGNPKDTQRMDKNKIKNIIEEYRIRKGFPTQEDPELTNFIYKRNCGVAKRLLILAKGDDKLVIEAMNWFGDICDKKGLSWTLETIEKWFPEFLAKGKSNNYGRLLKKFGLKEK